MKRGAAALEIIVALLFLIPALTAGVVSLHAASRYLSNIKDRYNLNLRSSRLDYYLSLIIEDLDTYRFPVIPRIHDHGRLTFTNGELLPLMHGIGSHQPDAQSDAITGLELDSIYSLWISQRTTTPTSIEAHACLEFSASARLNDYRSFLGLSSNSMIELITTSIQPITDKCFRIGLRPTKSVILDEPASSIGNFIQVLVPIAQQFTIYIDQGHELRFLTHLGAELLENQPIIGGIKALKISQDQMQDPALTKINFEFSDMYGHLVHLAKFNHLGRRSPINLILNRFP